LGIDDLVRIAAKRRSQRGEAATKAAL